MNNKQSGFTIIELIVVIALLGILSAVALPRFIGVSENAHDASVEGAGAGFATGIALLKAQVVANGDLGVATADVQGYGDEELDVNSDGFAVGTTVASAGVPSGAGSCAELWTAIFDSNGPTASTAAGSNPDYTPSFDNPTCTFTYRVEKDGAARQIIYNTDTGNVETIIPAG